ncbi:MAG: Crp/Fnr family transcriptional regulator [Bacteroidales bacterium]
MTGTYDLILQLPLFQGLSRDDLTRTIEKFSFHFEKFQPGDQIIRRGETCSRMVFILTGKVRSHLKNERETIEISETIAGPNMIAINHLYGSSQSYTADYYASTDVGIMTIDKMDLFRMIQTNEIFYYNVLNTLSVRAQNGVRTLLNMSMSSPESRFAMWLVPLTNPNTENLQLICRKTNLASILGISRPTLDTLLHGLADRGLIRSEKGVIHILDRQKFSEIIK